MKEEILPNGDLKLIAEPEDIKELKDLKENWESKDEFHTDDVMYDFFNDFMANSDFSWVQPEEVGALTSAPIIGILKEKDPTEEDPNDYVVDEAWAFMSYQLTSVQEQLLEQGWAIFTRAK